MGSLQDFTRAQATAKPVKAPQGWEPGIKWDGATGTGTVTALIDGEPDQAIWSELIADWGLDPDKTEVIDGSVQVRGWDMNVGGGEIVRHKYYRASIRKRQVGQDGSLVDVDALIKWTEKWKPTRQVNPVAGDRALVVLLSDFQMGKGEGGGSEKIIDRAFQALNELKVHIAALKKLGRLPSAVYLIGMGDLVEQCNGHYPMQAFSTDLTRRDQMNIISRIIIQFIELLVPLEIPIVLGAVPGNHGENRRGGKSYTDWSDNDDLGVFDAVRLVIEGNPEHFANVYIPLGAISDDLTMTMDIAGVPVGFAHGHQANRPNQVETWWRDQAMGNQKVGAAQLLFTGHFHYLNVSEASGRWWFQCPSLDGGSYWYTAKSGANSPPGLLVVSVGTAYGPRGWGDLVVLGQGERNGDEEAS